jgi:hypothetical protein
MPKCLQRGVALVRHRRGDAAVIVAAHHEHAAERAGAEDMAVLERVTRAVHARALAVPQGEDAIDVRAGSSATRCVPRHAVAARSSLMAGRNCTPAASSAFLAFHICWSTMPSGLPR